MDIVTLPLDRIDADALPRDRARIDPAAQEELLASIARFGLRMPLEVCATDKGYALISGYRRLLALRRLGREDAPVVVLHPATLAEALTLMVEENAIRADISPWEQAKIAVTARDADCFDTLDAAVAGLYPAANRQRRARLRDIAGVVECLDGIVAAPETLSQNQLIRLSAACRGGFADLMAEALTDLGRQASPQAQWEVLTAICTEAELTARGDLPQDPREGRPRRRVRVRPRLTIRREWAPQGWTLRFTGPEATGGLMEDIMDYVEMNFGFDRCE